MRRSMANSKGWKKGLYTLTNLYKRLDKKFESLDDWIIQ
jgi:hypothetical protein